MRNRSRNGSTWYHVLFIAAVLVAMVAVPFASQNMRVQASTQASMSVMMQ